MASEDRSSITRSLAKILSSTKKQFRRLKRNKIFPKKQPQSPVMNPEVLRKWEHRAKARIDLRDFHSDNEAAQRLYHHCRWEIYDVNKEMFWMWKSRGCFWNAPLWNDERNALHIIM
jgi:hypothetical protein